MAFLMRHVPARFVFDVRVDGGSRGAVMRHLEEVLAEVPEVVGCSVGALQWLERELMHVQAMLLVERPARDRGSMRETLRGALEALVGDARVLQVREQEMEVTRLSAVEVQGGREGSC